jgi:hypothetical protein
LSAPAELPAVGYVGADVPVELITAAGLLPLRLAGKPGTDSTPGDRYLGRGVDPVARSILTRILTGDYGPLEAIVVSRDCEASLRLFYALRELHRVEPELRLPPVRLVDVLHLPHHTTTRYVHAKIAGLREWPVTTATALVDGVLAAGSPEVEGLRLFLTGSSHDDPAVYETLERHGFLVVGEDHDWGELLFARTCAAPTELALAERYQHNGPSAPRASVRQRAAHTAAAARAGDAEVLLSYARVHDDAPPWDFPDQRAATGLRAVLAERQPYGELTEDALAALLPAGAPA